MAYGIIEYDDDGKPICEMCGKSFHRVLSHVRQKHDMTEKEYKLEFGFDLYKGICSKESSEKTRIQTLNNYDRVIKDNLIANGAKTRFKPGSPGRTKDKVSEQTRKMLVERCTTDSVMVAHRVNSGRIVGLSGVGNIKRWDKTSE